jgi:hypothetical protein
LSDAKSPNPAFLTLARSTYNRAFELIESNDEKALLEGLELAATSLHLWRQLGTDKNLAIGYWLYSRALFKSGVTTLAIEAANECVRHAKFDGTDWLIASALEGLARATAGTPSFENNRANALAAIEAIADADDRALIESQFADLK